MYMEFKRRVKGIGFFDGKVENFKKYKIEMQTFIGWNRVKFETKKIKKS